VRPFYEITARGRALRLRRLALEALEGYDLDPTRVSLITNETNGIFRVDTADRERYALRVCLPGEIGHSRTEILSETMWLDALARESDLLIPAPVRTREGRLFTEARVRGVPEGRYVCVFTWVPGRDIADVISPRWMREYGAFAARLHERGAAFQPPEGFNIRRFDSAFPYSDSVIIFDESNRARVPPECEPLFREVVDRTERACRRLAAAEPARVIHADLHQWNVRVYRDEVGAVDFEDLLMGWPAQDLAIALYYLHGTDEYVEFREEFQRGYSTVSPWPEREPGGIDLFIAARSVSLANYLAHDPDPAWQAAVPSFYRRTEARLRALLSGEPFFIKDYPLEPVG
jgi:Ser/Thr protein kinase RdoA (MazF antagonist)